MFNIKKLRERAEEEITKNAITEEQYQYAISDLSELRNLDFDTYLANYQPISGGSVFSGRHFHKKEYKQEGDHVIALVNRLILQGHVKSSLTKSNELGVLEFTDEQMRQLRAMYRDHILQDFLMRVEKDRALIDEYANQPAKFEGKRRALQLPIVRPQDQINDLRKSLHHQSKKYERQAAVNAMKQQKERYRKMGHRANR